MILNLSSPKPASSPTPATFEPARVRCQAEENVRSAIEKDSDFCERLTAREVDVLRLLVAGRTNAEIAEALFVSLATARTHVANIYRKLGVGNRAEAADVAHRHALLPTAAASA